MGQEQSVDTLLNSPSSSTSRDGGVHRVHGTGTSLDGSRRTKDAVDKLVEKSEKLRVPQQILPPPPVKDDMSSALQGAQVMHELRSALGGLLGGIEESETLKKVGLSMGGEVGDKAREAVDEGVKGKEGGQGDDVGEDEEGGLKRRMSSIEEFAEISERDTRAEQDMWARLGMDEKAVTEMLEQCTGGEKMEAALEQQERLMSIITALKDKAGSMRASLDRNGDEAKRMTTVVERLDRIHVTLADVQEGLESAVATANILGAAHFAHDDEMCSFKNFLRHNPPKEP